MAGADPGVPSNCTMLHFPPVCFASHSPAMRPSSTKSDAISVAYRLSSLTLIPRSTSTTGIPACFTSVSTGSQPVSTTGARMMASSFCATNDRRALIWFSCFCCASENFRAMFRFFASAMIDFVSAVRQALSAPIWLKPTRTRCSRSPQPATASAARAMPSHTFLIAGLLQSA